MTAGGGMQGYLSRFPAAEIEVGDAGILLDMDTPADYAALLKYLGLPTVPDETAVPALLSKYGAPDSVALHGRQVAELALRLSNLLRRKGVQLDDGLLASACLLHDFLRDQPEHARAGADVLLREGYPDTAMLVARHMDLPEDYVPQPDELALLYLADKLSRGGQTVPPPCDAGRPACQLRRQSRGSGAGGAGGLTGLRRSWTCSGMLTASRGKISSRYKMA